MIRITRHYSNNNEWSSSGLKRIRRVRLSAISPPTQLTPQNILGDTIKAIDTAKITSGNIYDNLESSVVSNVEKKYGNEVAQSVKTASTMAKWGMGYAYTNSTLATIENGLRTADTFVNSTSNKLNEVEDAIEEKKD